MFTNVGKILQTLLDIVLPRRLRMVRAETLTLADLSVTPQAYEACGTRITTLMDYRNRAVEDCVRALKYDGSSDATTLLASALADYLEEEVANVQTFSARRSLIAPMPLHVARKRERGFNQIERVLIKLPREFQDGSRTMYAPHVITRIRNTSPQTKLSRHERLTNVSGAFAADAKGVRGTHVYLIDDVTTTGATLAEAAKTLCAAGASVSAIALARA